MAGSRAQTRRHLLARCVGVPAGLATVAGCFAANVDEPGEAAGDGEAGRGGSGTDGGFGRVDDGGAVGNSGGSSDGGSGDGGSSDGGSSDGGSSDGDSSDGDSSDGGSSDGDSSDGDSSDGGNSDGGNSDGDSSDGGSGDGDSNDGDSSDGDSSDGDSSDGGSGDGGSGGPIEVVTRATPSVITTDDLTDGEATVVVAVRSVAGEQVTAGRVLVRSGTAQVATSQSAPIGAGTEAFGDDGSLADNRVGFAFSGDETDDNHVSLPEGASEGALAVEVVPAAESPYVDGDRNPPILVATPETIG